VFPSYLSTHLFAYQSEPFCPDRMVAVLASAGDMAKLRLKRRTPTEIQGLIGNSSGIQNLSGQISRSADAGYPILITGEVGSGKSAAAQAIHLCSRRRDQALRKIRSIAFPAALPARVQQPHPIPAQNVEPCDDSAILEAAEVGTLVLDEIGDLSQAAQRTLLQLLARTGRKIHLVALTHMDLSKAVAENRFRADLLQKLSDVHLVTPPLRERGDDVLLLAQHFLTSFWDLNRHISGFSDAAMHAMQQHAWPGNVRELRCRVRRGMLMSDDRLVHREDLGLSAHSMRSSSRGL
jgi:DNA-binding NtrC family response regulator